ncbi:hypothetical protein V8E53_013785 [Lactarius tabidus]|jgi:hypothetical protein
MIIQLVESNTSKSFTCAQENYYCRSTQGLSAQINNSDSSSTTGATHTPALTRRNLIGVLVIAALLFLGITLWLCFGKWSKPIRHFFKGKSRSSSRYNAGATVFGIGDGLRAAAAPKRVAGPEGADVEKAEIMDSSSNSTQSSLIDHKINEGDKLELAVPAKVHISLSLTSEATPPRWTRLACVVTNELVIARLYRSSLAVGLRASSVSVDIK